MKSFVTILICVFFYKTTFQCQWQSYRTVREGPYNIGSLTFAVQRSTAFCVHNKTIYNFQTSRNLLYPKTGDWGFVSTNNFGVCSGNCFSKTVNIPITCIYIYNGIRVQVNFNYNNKNLTKFIGQAGVR